MPKNIASLIDELAADRGRRQTGTGHFDPRADGQNYLVPESVATIRRREREADQREKYFESPAYLRRKVSDIR